MFVRARIISSALSSGRRLASRSLIALMGGFFLMLGLFWVEILLGREQGCPTDISWLICQLENSVFMETAETFGFLVATILFVLDAPDRQKQSNYEAWQAIDGAYNLETSYARIEALQDLNNRGESLRGLDAVKADLTGIQLEGVKLYDANLKGSILRKANLRRANLDIVNFQNADLQSVNFQGASLRGANLRGADLRGANLRNSDLRRADLRGANLQGADLLGANYQGSTIEDVGLGAGRFESVENGFG